MKARLLGSTGIVIAVVLLLAVNILANTVLTSARLDFTEDKLYTLSSGTERILASLDEPVTLRLYLSQELAAQLPGISSYAARVRELLSEYELRAGGNLQLKVLDPEPFSEEEDRAVGYGIRGVPLSELDETFYFGLVGTNTVGEQRVIAFFNQAREQFLEYDITRLVQQLDQTEQRVVGLMTSLAIAGVNADRAPQPVPRQSYTVLDQIRETFVVEYVDPSISRIPDNIDVLLIVHPRELTDDALYAIDQFVMGGGNAVVLADPYAESDGRQTAIGAPNVTETDFNRILETWGVSLEPGKVVADLQFATRVQTTRDGKVVVFEYPVWVTLPPELISPLDTVTSDLNTLAFASIGSLLTLANSGVEVETLIRSSPDAMRVSITELGYLSDPEELLRQYEPEGEQFSLAVRITGKPKSAFPQGPPSQPQPQDDAAAPVHVAQAREDISIVVVADTDFLQDRFWVQTQNFLGSVLALPFAGNGNLVINALDNLTGSNDLISIRNRGTSSRPFERVGEIRRDAELKFRQKEQELIARLEQTEQELLQLETQKQGDDALILSEAQQTRLNQFRQERVQIRRELRDVRHELRKDIERLEGWLKFVNIGLVPLLIGLGGLFAAAFKRQRRKASIAAQSGSREAGAGAGA